MDTASIALITSIVWLIIALIGFISANRKLGAIQVNVDGRLSEALKKIDEGNAIIAEGNARIVQLKTVIEGSNKSVPPTPSNE